MNVFAPVSSIMTRDLVTVNPEDSLKTVSEIFEKNRIHHLPVVRYKKIVGIISHSDFDHFVGGLSRYPEDRFLNESRLKHHTAEEIMTARLAKIEPDDRLNAVIDIFCLNRFHALPVVENDELVGIITPFDILRKLASEKPLHPEDVYETILN